MPRAIERNNQQDVKKGGKKLQKGVREGGRYSKKLKKSLLKIKTYLGVLTCSGLQEALIKLNKFCFLYKIHDKYIAIRSDRKRLEIFDPCGFLKNKQTHSLIKFIKAHSLNRNLVFNKKAICSSQTELACLLFLTLHNLTDSFNKTLSNVTACIMKMNKKV